MSINLIKLAADIVGKAALEERFSPQLSTLDQVLLQKQAAADEALLVVAATLSGDGIMNLYEQLGGDYEERTS
jgi:hypothetical protein